MQELCLCSSRLLDVNHSDYVVPDRYRAGVVRPACTFRCYERYLDSCALKEELRRKQNERQLTLSFDVV